MSSFNLTHSIELDRSSRCFIIAEIGQNHQGNMSIAKNLIQIAKKCGADCVKFQKTCLTEKFTQTCLKRSYSSPNSWGSTYGAHKDFLEFSPDQFKELQRYAKRCNILFTASAMDPASLDFLCELRVPFIKIGSGDANNPLLIEKAARKRVPLVISTGMQDLKTVREIYKTVSKYHKNFALLHCVSAYPTPVHDVNLKVIKLFKKEFPDIVVGYSGHELGTDISVAAVVLGSKIIERHITLSKYLKGSDHVCSLEPNEFAEMVAKIRTIEIAMGRSWKVMQPCENACFRKLSKSLVAARSLISGSILQPQDIKIKVSEPKGIDGSQYCTVIGRVIIKDIKEDDPITSCISDLTDMYRCSFVI